MFFAKNVHCVVDGDDADEAIFGVHDRHGQIVVAVEGLRDKLLIVKRAEGNDVGFHDVGNAGGVVAEQQLFDGNHAFQMTLPIDDVAGVDGFLVDSEFTNALKRFLNGGIFAEPDVFGGHYGAGAVLGIFQNFVDFFARLRIGVGKDTPDDVGRHFFDDVNRVVDEKIVDDFLKLLVGKTLYKSFLPVRIHFDKGFACQIFPQKPEHDGKLFLRYLRKQRCDVGRIQVVEIGLKLMILFVVKKFRHFFDGLFKIEIINLQHFAPPFEKSPQTNLQG